jgi:hypothetical protein
MEGGYAWQDDPFLEEYPYSFVRTDSIEGLREYFGGNWALRQGILYDDLAFIQQVDGGDEWWTLKKLPDGKWLDFESWSFRNVRKDPVEFNRAIVSMQMATPEECSHLDYMLPDEGKNPWSFERRLETSADGKEGVLPELLQRGRGRPPGVGFRNPRRTRLEHEGGAPGRDGDGVALRAEERTRDRRPSREKPTRPGRSR